MSAEGVNGEDCASCARLENELADAVATIADQQTEITSLTNQVDSLRDEVGRLDEENREMRRVLSQVESLVAGY